WLRRPHGVIPALSGIDVERARAVCDRALAERGEGWLLQDEVNELLDAFGIPMAPSVLCKTPAEAARAAEEVGFPVAVKLASATLVHKTEWNGVRLNLKTPAEVEKAFGEIAKTLAEAGRLDEMLGVVVQPMIKGGVETMIGVTQDPSF